MIDSVKVPRGNDEKNHNKWSEKILK